MKRLLSKYRTWLNRRRIARLARAVAARQPDSSQPTVAFFNASTRLTHLSLNAAFSRLAAWSLRLVGVPVVHFVCQQGMSHCVLGTNPDDPEAEPPCAACIQQSKRLFAGAEVGWFSYQESQTLAAAVANRSLAELQLFAYQGIPLGQIALPSLRWALRRHHLVDDEGTRFLYRQYILSAFNVGREFSVFLDQHQPQAVVLFNGVMYPEAMARRLAEERGLRVITHEVGLRPFSAFFTAGQATAYPMDIPADFQLSDKQNNQLDAYLKERFQGRFSMAGVEFWPQMQALDADFLTKAAQFEKLVPVFTNVIFDTSQIHANTLFPHMFAWLDAVLDLIKTHPETLFVLRAHPDETRAGKQSRESVAQWVLKKGVIDLPNVVFFDSEDYISSYALIQRAHFVMLYNSSIGLEAAIMGKAVLSAGAARFTQYSTVFFPDSATEYQQIAEQFLIARQVHPEAHHQAEARRVFYFQLFRTSLPFDQYLQVHGTGYVRLKDFAAEALLPGNSATMRAIHDGILAGGPFLV